MNWYIYELKFETPVHFGLGQQGGTLADVTTEFPADSLFAALCSEAAAIGAQGLIERLVWLVQEKKLTLSDLLPCRYTKEKRVLFLPKPVYPFDGAAERPRQSLDEVRKTATALKKQKKMKYIAVDEMDRYLSAAQKGESFIAMTEPDLGKFAVTERVNRRGREPLPYSVGAFSFREEAGLYGLLGCEEENIDWLTGLLEQLGMSGIGGKRSSGFGKFELVGDICPLDDSDQMEGRLLKMLEAADAPWQMLLSGLCPQPDELETVGKGFTVLHKRSGFSSSPSGDCKHNDLYLLAAGSCLPGRPDGGLMSVGQLDGHEIWRYGCGMYAGLKI